jgi:hypothetical protein
MLMNTKTKILGAAGATVAALTLAACGSGSATAGPPPSAAQVAASHGMTLTDKIVPPTLYAASEVAATKGGTSYDVATFRTNELRDRWVKAASQFDGPPVAKGDRYAIEQG